MQFFYKNLHTPVSDLDILIVLRKRKKSLSELYEEFLEKIEEKVELPYLWNNEFIILYEKERFFSEFLKKLKKPMPHFEIKKVNG